MPGARLMVLAYMVFVPWTGTFFSWLSVHDYARIAQVGLSVVCGLAVVPYLWRLPFNRPPSTMELVWLSTVAILAALSVSCAPMVAKALQEAALLLGLVAIAIAVGSTHSQLDVSRCAQAVIFSSLLYCGFMLLVLCIGMFNGYAIRVGDVGMGYENQRFFNHVQTVALPLAAAAIHMGGLSRRWVAAAWVALVMGFTWILVSGSRGTAVAIACAALVSPLWMHRSSWSGLRPLLVGMLAGYAIYFGLFVLMPRQLGLAGGIELAQRALDPSSARLYLWELAGTYMAESPWFGIGPMHYAYRPNLKAAHPHNVYLQVAAEWGIPMLIMLGFGVAAAFTRAARLVRTTDMPSAQRVGGLLLVACAAVLIDGAVSGNFVMPVSQVWIAVCTGITLQWFRNSPARHVQMQIYPPTPSATPTVLARSCAAVLALSTFTQLTLLIRDINSFTSLSKVSQEISISDRFTPRFWFNGWFSEDQRSGAR